MFTFEVTSYPEAPCDIALFGAREWRATAHVHDAPYATKYPDTLDELQACCEIAGLTVADLLYMVARGHVTISYKRD